MGLISYIIFAVTHFGVGHYQLDVSSNITYQVVEDVLTEVSELFPDEYIHIGGDEVYIYRSYQI